MVRKTAMMTNDQIGLSSAVRKSPGLSTNLPFMNRFQMDRVENTVRNANIKVVANERNGVQIVLEKLVSLVEQWRKELIDNLMEIHEQFTDSNNVRKPTTNQLKKGVKRKLPDQDELQNEVPKKRRRLMTYPMNK